MCNNKDVSNILHWGVLIDACVVSAPSAVPYITCSSWVCCGWISRFIIQPVAASPAETKAAMGLTKALLALRLAGFPPLHQLFALVCIVFVIYKFITLVALRQKILQDFETFIGPPGHWLFGHTFEVLAQGTAFIYYTQQLLNRGEIPRFPNFPLC